ncbi:MAG TPA: GNAT family N-acetyltransferase [Roseomonas sp.]|jgi:predicted GNAT family acetyltransferase
MTDADTAKQLDNPVWAALTTGHGALAEGGPLAWRYPPDIAPFAAITDRTAASFAALAALVPPGGRLALATADQLAPPAGLAIDRQAPIIQMVLDAPIAVPPAAPDHVPLSAGDVADMLDLAGRTRPGPFGPRTIALGDYIGIRAGGVLAAMAGERMRFGCCVEISAVCVDPAHRGKGLAAMLMARLAHRLQARALTPFLHVFADNAGAIALYEKLGFTRRRTLQLTVLSKARS